MANIALVVSGGGAKGAFAVGVLDSLQSRGKLPTFDLYIGTSTGSLICPLMSVDGLQTLIDTYTSVSDTDFATVRDLPTAIAQNDSLFDTTPLWNLIQHIITPAIANQILTSTTRTVLLVTVNMQTSETVYFQAGPDPVPTPFLANARVIQLQTRDELMRAMLASASEPVFTPLVKVLPTRDPVPGSQYCDGGVRTVTPLEAAIAYGAMTVYCIALYPASPPPLTQQFTSFLDVVLRTFSLYGDAIGEDNIQTGKDLAATKGATVNLVQPIGQLGDFGLSFSPVQMAQMMQQGRDRAQTLFP
jgi:NTE family protein